MSVADRIELKKPEIEASLLEMLVDRIDHLEMDGTQPLSVFAKRFQHDEEALNLIKSTYFEDVILSVKKRLERNGYVCMIYVHSPQPNKHTLVWSIRARSNSRRYLVWSTVAMLAAVGLYNIFTVVPEHYKGEGNV